MSLSSTEHPKELAYTGKVWEVFQIALPLILSNSCHAVNMFVDRLMLAHYSQEAVAASFTGGLTNFTLACFFVGTIGYVGTFVAQYSGAGQKERVGEAVWQGLWLSIVGCLIVGSGYFWARPLFELFHHAPQITAQEVAYFQVLCLGMVIFMAHCALPCFWAGRGKTSLVLAISVIITLFNIPLNYLLIFGKFGCSELGVRGAAWGTVLSEGIGVIIYFILFLSKRNRKKYHTGHCGIDLKLQWRIIQYGFPSGIQLALDLLSFNIFGILLGCYGVAILEATSITFGINNIAFCPVVGIAATAAILVGQAIGAQNIPLARKGVRSCLMIVFLYNLAMILLFTLFQEVVLGPFIRPNDPAQIEAIAAGRTMLYFVAAYLLFDGFNIVTSNAIRGAGDTRFCMWTMVIAGMSCLALPCFICYRLGAPWQSLWMTFDGYVLLLAIIFTGRYLQGKWTKMRVIEQTLPEATS